MTVTATKRYMISFLFMLCCLLMMYDARMVMCLCNCIVFNILSVTLVPFNLLGR